MRAILPTALATMTWVDPDCPQHARCRTVFTELAPLVRALLAADLPDDVIPEDVRNTLASAAAGR